MNYKKIYESIILRAKIRQQPDCYTEKHHIVPRCMGGDDSESNLAILTPEEHYVCHQLLVKIYPSNIKLLYAAHALSKLHSKNHPLSRKLTNKKYGWLRRRHSALQRTGSILICKCGEEFYVAKYRLNKYKTHYCSKKCMDKFNPMERKNNTIRISVPCLGCGKHMILSEKMYNYTNKKHCSYKCAGKSQTKRQGGVREITCYICSKRFIRSNSLVSRIKDPTRQCCSRICYNIRRTQH